VAKEPAKGCGGGVSSGPRAEPYGVVVAPEGEVDLVLVEHVLELLPHVSRRMALPAHAPMHPT
jgi:uncharacterized spore protein YtfJ